MYIPVWVVALVGGYVAGIVTCVVVGVLLKRGAENGQGGRR